MRVLVLLKMVQLATALSVLLLLLVPTEVCVELTPAHFISMVKQSETCKHTLLSVLEHKYSHANDSAADYQSLTLTLFVPETSVCMRVDLSRRYCSTDAGCLDTLWLLLPTILAFLSLPAIGMQLFNLLRRKAISSDVDHCFALSGLLVWVVSAVALATISFDWKDHTPPRFGHFPAAWAAAHLWSWVTAAMFLVETLLCPLYGDLMWGFEPPHKMYVLPDGPANDEWSDEI